MNTTPIWRAEIEAPLFPALSRDLRVDVLVVGGGITGITTAFLLKRAGRTVALIERGEIGGGETGHTTAHITFATDKRLTRLVKTFGRDHAQAAWDAGNFAMEQIADIAATDGIDCELRRVPGYLAAAGCEASPTPQKDFQDEAALAAELGFDAAFVQEAPLLQRPAIRFPNQLKFHPLKFLLALAQRIPGEGSHVFEKTEAGEFPREGGKVMANGHAIRFDYAVFATHVPLQGHAGALSAALLQTKLAAYSTYAVGAKLPGTDAPEALFWDTADPYHYLRVDRRADDGLYAILGGADHKTGQEKDTEKPFAILGRTLHTLWPDAAIDHRWSGQVIESVDGLPYIGETSERQFVATGFSGNGITFGMLAALMARDRVLGLQNPWQDLFSVDRKELSSLWNYVKENKDYPYYLAKGISGVSGDSLNALGRGQGKILRLCGQKVAGYRDEQGAVTVLSPICPHLGCTVAWNGAEKTWDCPCHGSRFTAKGEVIAGPAGKPLAIADVPKPTAETVDVHADTSTLAKEPQK